MWSEPKPVRNFDDDHTLSSAPRVHNLSVTQVMGERDAPPPAFSVYDNP